MNTTSIQKLKDKAVSSLYAWMESRIDGLAASNPKLAVASVYLKRGAKNLLSREGGRIAGMIDDASLFICDGEGNVDASALFDDLMSAFRTMEEIPFGTGMLRGTAGKGVIRFALPDNPLASLLFGDVGALTITESDLLELKAMLTDE